MKKITIALLAIAMLFAFVACEDNGSDTRVATVTTENEFVSTIESASVTGIDKIVLGAPIALDEPVAITKAGLEIVGSSDNVLTVSNSAEYIGAKGMLNINADNVKLTDVYIEVPEASAKINVIYTNNSGVTINGSSIKWLGEVTEYTNVENSDINMAVDVDANGSARIVGTSFTNCVTPVYSSSADVAIESCKFNSGIEFEVVSAVTKVTDCTPVGEGDVLGTAKVSVWYDGVNKETATAFLDSVSGDNIITRLYNTSTSDYEAYPAE